ncbi:MAG: DUF362 domain-containing protein [Bryobacteraceae bacterium]|jgi:uncharacterized protein (DUF362 family)
MDPRIVAVQASACAEYPAEAPFHPQAGYPEYDFGETGGPNHVYEVVRQCFAASGLDASRYGTGAWNPLSEFINPGERVVIKPNLVKETHPRDSMGWRYVLTHGSVIRAITDYVWKALDGRGTVVVADAPQTDSSFDAICQLLGLCDIAEFYRRRGLDFALIDLRREEWVNRGGVIVARRKLAGDPRGYCRFDLGQASEFFGHCGAGRYYGADYDSAEVNCHHTGGRHEYLVSRTVIEADVVFSVPKMKTHKKAGTTGALKNLVGINGDKNWLPHHTEGDPSCGGDEYPHVSAKHRTERRLVRSLAKLSMAAPDVGPWLHRQARRLGGKVFGETEEVIRSGNWWGNDTVWRMCLDLNKILLFGETDGGLRAPLAKNRKRHIALVDGIVAGEGRGPMNPDPVEAGIVIFGANVASVDAVSAVLMGFDPERIPLLRQAFRCNAFPLTDWTWPEVQIVSNRSAWSDGAARVPRDATFNFEPHFGWKGHIERTTSNAHALD